MLVLVNLAQQSTFIGNALKSVPLLLGFLSLFFIVVCECLLVVLKCLCFCIFNQSGLFYGVVNILFAFCVVV